jgi:hypothetical protein
MAMGRKLCVLALILLSLGVPANGTSIVILRNANKVYVGADSRRSYREPGRSYAGTVCKIVPAGRLLFVASGLTYADNRQVSDIGAEVGSKSATASQAIEEFRNRMSSFLPEALSARDQVESAAGSRDGLVLEAAFIGFENDVAKVSMEWFRVEGSRSNLTVTTDRHSYTSRNPGRYDFLFLGKRHAIDQYLSHRSPVIRSTSEAVQFIRLLIGLEVAESPETTAPPIDILQLTSYGPEWLQQKPGCDGE